MLYSKGYFWDDEWQWCDKESWWVNLNDGWWVDDPEDSEAWDDDETVRQYVEMMLDMDEHVFADGLVDGEPVNPVEATADAVVKWMWEDDTEEEIAARQADEEARLADIAETCEWLEREQAGKN